jgi:hypothetical protein
MKIIFLRPSEIHALSFPGIDNGTLANIQTSNVGLTHELLKQRGIYGSQRKHLKMEYRERVYEKKKY